MSEAINALRQVVGNLPAGMQVVLFFTWIAIAIVARERVKNLGRE
jgi:hypothetical protein